MNLKTINFPFADYGAWQDGYAKKLWQDVVCPSFESGTRLGHMQLGTLDVKPIESVPASLRPQSVLRTVEVDGLRMVVGLNPNLPGVLLMQAAPVRMTPADVTRQADCAPGSILA